MNVHPGELVRWKGDDHRVVAVRPAYVTLRGQDEEGDDIEVLRADLLANAEPAGVRSSAEILDLRLLDDLAPADRKIVDVWLEELERLSELLDKGATKKDAHRSTIDRVNRRLGTDYEVTKVARQVQSLDELGVAGLLDRRRFGLADRSVTKQDSRLVEAVVSVLEEQTRKSTGTKERVIWMIERELERAHGPGAVSLPSRATIYRLIGQLEAGRSTFGSARLRRTTANQPNHVHGTRTGVRPGEQVLIDTTPMEVLVSCDGQAVRPDLTILLDECSRGVLAAIVTVGTRSIDLVVVLARALVPYSARPEGVRRHRRTIAQAWVGDDALLAERFEDARLAQPYIFPESITTDRGASYVSRHFTDACRTMEISLTLAAKYTPTQKAKVERMFRTIKDGFTEYLVGFLGQSPEMRGDEVMDVDQLLTLEQLQELLEDWIAAVWQNRPHDALRDPRNPRLRLTPNQMVAAYRELVPELQIPLDADRYIAMLPTHWRAIHSYGIKIEHRRYDADALAGLRRMRSPHRAQNGRWPVHVDPYNPMTVWLETGDEFIPLAWRSPYQDAPMADEVWRIARAHAAARGEQEPTNADLNDAIRRFGSLGNRIPTSRERKRAIKNVTDPLGITGQLPHASLAPQATETSSADDHRGKAVDDYADLEQRLAPPFGRTRAQSTAPSVDDRKAQ